MPGTPIQAPPVKEDHFLFANRKATEIASKFAHPVGDPHRYAYFYWQVMAGYGFVPYVPGCTRY